MLRQVLRHCCFNAASSLLLRVRHCCHPAALAMTRPVIPPAALDRFRNAAAQFALHATPRASRLLTIKDDIAALRKRGVSYRAISELLTQSGIAASDTCVMRFCHRVFKKNPSRQPSAARTAAPAVNRDAAPKSAPDTASKAALPAALVLTGNIPPAPSENTPFRSRGPHIAKVELLKPDEI